MRIQLLIPNLVLAATLAAGCGGTTRIYLKGLKPLNMNEQNENTPVDVRVYLLKDSGRFNRATFEELWVNDSEALGEDKVGAARVRTVLPGDAADEPVELGLGQPSGDVRFIGIMGLFRDKGEEGTNRHIAVPIDDARGSVFTFREYGVKQD